MFYNRLLRCYVLIDLKPGKLTHQDLGQMQMYVNYFDRYVKTDDELPTIGFLLCDRKKDAIVKLTLPKTPTSTRRNPSSTCRRRRSLPSSWRWFAGRLRGVTGRAMSEGQMAGEERHPDGVGLAPDVPADTGAPRWG